MNSYGGDGLYSSMAQSGFIKTNFNEKLKSIQKFVSRLHTQDMIGIAIFLGIMPVGFFYAIIYPLSFWYQLFSKEWLFRVLPLSMMGFNVYVNAWMIFRIGPNTHSGILPSVLKPGYHYCHSCHINAPSRSFHCPVCDVCILRRDHHCSFTGSCIGHFNQRYFVAAIVNLWPITFVCCIWNWHALQLAFTPFSPADPLKWMFPHVALLLRLISVYQFLMIVAFAFSMVALIFDTYLIGAQLFCFTRGQTRVEYLMDVHAYNLNFRENLRQALGSHWPLIFLSPFIPSPLESDGTSFRTRDREEIGKTTKYF